jgi:3-hydroxymyristoyl/3-hydroxydecanoyl-(acyl carrier protein) dehydratase
MIGERSAEVEDVLRRAQKEPLIPRAERLRGPSLDRAAIEALLPHRGTMLLLDRVEALDVERGLVAARFDLGRARDVFNGHFPGRPVFPGVLQVEAIGQAGIVLLARRAGAPAEGVALTHVLGARFLAPIGPEGDLEVLARVLEDGLFFTIVGQCVRGDEVRSVAAVSGLSD